jgi:hypothetical protein
LANAWHLAGDFSATTWRANAWAFVEEIADGAGCARWQGARSCPGARTPDIEKLVQLTWGGTFARPPDAWLATRSNSGLGAPQASATTRTGGGAAATASPEATAAITDTSPAAANGRATATDSAAAGGTTATDSAAATATAAATTTATTDQVARQEYGDGRYHCYHNDNPFHDVHLS